MERDGGILEQYSKKISTEHKMDTSAQTSTHSALHFIKTCNYFIPEIEPPCIKRQHNTASLASSMPQPALLRRQTFLPNGPYPLLMPLKCLKRKQRSEKNPIPNEQKDDKYFEKRKRNNEAAKKSRDARKMREDRIALKAALLERENSILRSQIFALQEEVYALTQIVCFKNVSQNLNPSP
ncbi:transcription factor VBP [Ochlerotatus camptorhynchus]|uniref:transcription factor VBP n=1 Tax=Ochlerotatus camptorhynchus TaxID=644619 RepID=UPI0031D93405